MSGFDPSDLPGFGNSGGLPGFGGNPAPTGFDAAPPQQQQQQQQQQPPQQQQQQQQQQPPQQQQHQHQQHHHHHHHGHHHHHHGHHHHHHGHHQHQHHQHQHQQHYQPQYQQQHQQYQPQQGHGSPAPPAGGSISGMGDMVGGRGPQGGYNMRSYDLPQGGGQGYPPQQQQQFGEPIGRAGYDGGRGGYGGRGGGYGGRGGGGGGFSSRQQQPTNTIFLGNVGQACDDAFLMERFGAFGKVLKIQRMWDKGHAFVHYQHVEEAVAAHGAANAERFCGDAKVGFGKLFNYSPEELDQLERYGQARSNRPPGEGGFNGSGGGGAPMGMGGGGGGGGGGRNDNPPSNICFVGDVPYSLGEAQLRSYFEPFGTITQVVVLGHKGIGFVHFATVEEAAKAVSALQGTLLGGLPLRVAFGKPQEPRMQQPQGFGGGPGGPPVDRAERDPPTNVVFIGALAPSVMLFDVEEVCKPHEGFIDAKLFSDKAFAFAHFETVEQAMAARRALNGVPIHGQPIRAGFGKNNHTRTRDGGFGGPGGAPPGQDLSSAPAYDQFGNPILVPPQGINGQGGALVAAGGAGQVAALPGETQGNVDPAAANQLVPSYVSRPREVPAVTLDRRVNGLGSTSYFSCNVQPPYMSHTQVKDLIECIDGVVDENTQQQLLDMLTRFAAPTTLSHTIAVVAKRLKDHFNADPHKKLLVLYPAALVVHQASRPRAHLDTFAMLLSVVANGQCNEGAAHVAETLKSFRTYCDVESEADAALLESLKTIEDKSRTASDINNLLSKVKSAATGSA